MKPLVTFTAQPDSDGIYRVEDRLSGLVSIGRVARVGARGPWIATPGRGSFDGPRKAFATRGEAGYALSRYGDDGNRDWIYPTVNEEDR